MSGSAGEHVNMHNARADDRANRRAFSNLTASINLAARLPSQIFLGSWSRYLFFESDYLFSPHFAAIAAGLLKAERAEVCCLLNFEETIRMDFESAAMVFLDSETEPKAFDTFLRRGAPTDGWLFGFDRFGSASDRGEWSIYCEKIGDIAVIAFRDHVDVAKFAEPLQRLRAYPITELVEPDTPIFVPYGQLLEHWRRGLIENYADRGR